VRGGALRYIHRNGYAFRSLSSPKSTDPWRKVERMIKAEFNYRKFPGVGYTKLVKEADFLIEAQVYESGLSDSAEDVHEEVEKEFTDVDDLIKIIPTTPFAGNGYGLIVPHRPDERCFITFAETKLNLGFTNSYYYTRKMRVPDHQPGDWLLHMPDNVAQELIDILGNYVLEARSIIIDTAPSAVRPTPGILPGSIRLGGLTARSVARTGDQVTVFVFGMPFTGTIIQGSSKVFAE